MIETPLTIKQVTLRVITIILLVEFIIMLLLAVIPLNISFYAEALIDVVLLALFSTPLIYVWVIKPFMADLNHAFNKIKTLAHTDPLTQLANRRLLSLHLKKVIAETIRHQLHGAVVLLDLNGFKSINDNHGHDAGDAVLTEVAKRLQDNSRAEDIVARLGGDEFVVIIHHLNNKDQSARCSALQTACKLADLISQPIDFNGLTLKVTASIGVRLLDCEGLDTETAIREADMAMYHCKQTLGECIVFFDKPHKDAEPLLTVEQLDSQAIA